MKLNKNFYLKPTLTVARDLIGCVLVRKKSDGITSGKIVETEAYMGFEDKGSHSYKKNIPPQWIHSTNQEDIVTYFQFTALDTVLTLLLNQKMCPGPCLLGHLNLLMEWISC